MSTVITLEELQAIEGVGEEEAKRALFILGADEDELDALLLEMGAMSCVRYRYRDTEQQLWALDSVLGGYGVESVEGSEWIDSYYQEHGLMYVNKGETYAATVCFDTDQQEFFVGSWGSWVEEQDTGEEDDEDSDEEEW